MALTRCSITERLRGANFDVYGVLPSFPPVCCSVRALNADWHGNALIFFNPGGQTTTPNNSETKDNRPSGLAAIDIAARHGLVGVFGRKTPGVAIQAVASGRLSGPGQSRTRRTAVTRLWPSKAAPTTVESGAGALTLGSGGCSVAFAPVLSPAPMASFPVPRSSNRTCGFPASGFRTRSCLRARKAPGLPRETREAIVYV